MDNSTGSPDSGNVYIADRGNNRLDVFDSSSHFLRAFGWGVRNGSPELQVCTAACESGAIGTSRPGQVTHPSAVSVDPASHDLYVSEPEAGRIDKFTPSGEFVLMFGKGVDQGPHHPGDVCKASYIAEGDACGAGLRGTGEGQLDDQALPVAVDASGHVWVGDLNRLEQFGSEGEFLSETELPGASEISSLAIDSAGDFFTGNPPRNEVQEITPPPSGSYTLTFEGQTTAALPHDTPASCSEQEPGCLSVQTALEALSTIGAGNVHAAGAVGVQQTEVTFHRALGGLNVPQLEVSAGSVSTFTQGVPGQLAKRDSSGSVLFTLDAAAPYGYPAGIAFDPASGRLFVSDQLEPELNSGTATLLEYDSSGAMVSAFGAGQVAGHPQGNALAFGDAAQLLYVADNASQGSSALQAFALPRPGPLPLFGSTAATSVRKISATLCAKVNPEGAETKARFQYITLVQFERNEEEGHEGFQGALETPLSPSLGSDFSFGHQLCQPIASLQPGTEYRFRVVAHNTNGEVAGEAAELTTEPPAAIDSTSAADVTAESATLQAEINPLGDATSYRFEYLAESACLENEASGEPPFAGAAQAPLEAAPLGSGEQDVAVSQHLQGLAPHTAYRYRAVAINAITEHIGAPFAGPSLAFTTQALVAPGLPDSRAFELVSPPEKRGAQLKPQGILLTQAADSGEAISYLATVPTEANPLGNSNRTQLLSARGPAGWTTEDLTVPHPEATGASIGNGEEVRYFSSDLSHSVLHPFGAFEPLSPLASEQTPYLRTDFPPADPAALCASSCYLPLVSGAEGFANVPPGTEFGLAVEGKPCKGFLGGGRFCGPEFRGATPDLAHVVLSSRTALTEAPLPKKEPSAFYEWSAAAPRAESLRLISALPGGGVAATADGLGFPGARNAISADGSRVAFTAAGHLYLRTGATEAPSPISGSAVDGSQCTEPGLACTVQLDAVQSGGGSGSAKPVFQLASTDGRRVFFTDQQRLTAGSGAALDKPDLYEYDLARPEGERLIDLTPEAGGEPAEVQGLLPGASEGASYLYFVAQGALTGTEQNAQGEAAQPGRPNLYLRHAGATTYIATLLGEKGAGDAPDWGDRDGISLEALTARVSPDGRYLAFMSQRPLTGYDNRDAASGQRDEEVFLFHAAAAGGEGTLLCASCNPTGGRPRGVEYGDGGANLPLVGGDRLWSKSTWLAANLPGWSPFSTDKALVQPRYLSDRGRLFFDSSDALVPADTNGTEDVYTYEPPTGGAEEAPPNDSCTESAPTYSPASGGCVNLISSGASPEESAFLDASESGNDVFFLTASKLVGADKDTSLDVYDARVGGGFPEAAKPVECLGDSCQPPATPPTDATPGSLTFNGAGNVLEAKPRKHHAKHRHRHRKHARKHKRGSR